MALFVNVCFLVLLNFEMILLLKASYNYGIEISNKVSDANLVPVAEYSYVVLVNLTVKQTYCTGALISRTFVLTVAHCVYEETSTSARVYRGNLDEIFNGNVPKNTTNTTERVIRKGYEEMQSVAIIRPWLYEDSVNRYDIALIHINSTFVTSFVKAALYTTTFAQPNPIINCKAVGYNVAAIPKQQERHRPSNKSSVSMLIEQTITFIRQCETAHETDGKCYSTSWIVQQDKQFIDPKFANSSVLLFCSDSTTHKDSLNGIAVGKINISSSGMSSKPDYPLVFTDICPYLSWIRYYVGPSVKRSPGHYGEGCFYSMSSIGTQKKSIMAWIVVIVCILLYL